MRGATVFCKFPKRHFLISIHAPHAGCDIRRQGRKERPCISIHAPHAGCDSLFLSFLFVPVTFQSTHPMRGATGDRARQALPSSYFNPRTPCGVRLDNHLPDYSCQVISIHAPHAGCDMPESPAERETAEFQSTHPMRGATLRRLRGHDRPSISIHAPHAGCDLGALKASSALPHFNPRTPCGVRRHEGRDRRLGSGISIHAPHAGCDISIGRSRSSYGYFNPRTPCGVRRAAFRFRLLAGRFQSTHPMRGATSPSVPG